MSKYTQFLNLQVNNYPTNSPDPFFTDWAENFLATCRLNVKSVFNQSVVLIQGSLTSVSLPVMVAVGDWQVIMLKVVGPNMRLEVTAKDTNGVTNISNSMGGQGTIFFPGYILWSMQSPTAIALTSPSGTVTVEVYMAACEEDA